MISDAGIECQKGKRLRRGNEMERRGKREKEKEEI